MTEAKFANCVCYIEQNPIRRGLAATPEAYPFGSAAWGPLDPMPHHLRGKNVRA
ncbi:MAG: hypothetical protein WCF30_14510 [Terracidiphilus sp.]